MCKYGSIFHELNKVKFEAGTRIFRGNQQSIKGQLVINSAIVRCSKYDLYSMLEK